MIERVIHDGDIITFIALKYDEPNSELPSPAILLTPVNHLYEDGIELETVINEALLDIETAGRLREMITGDLSVRHDLSREHLRHIALLVERKQNPPANYRVLKETYCFRLDDRGKFRSDRIS